MLDKGMRMTGYQPADSDTTRTINLICSDPEQEFDFDGGFFDAVRVDLSMDMPSLVEEPRCVGFFVADDSSVWERELGFQYKGRQVLWLLGRRNRASGDSVVELHVTTETGEAVPDDKRLEVIEDAMLESIRKVVRIRNATREKQALSAGAAAERAG